MYCIGKFPDEDDCVAVFPKTWLLEGGQCLWPKKQSSVRKLSKRGDPLDPEKSNTCNVVVIGQYATYKDAQANLETATFTSDLETSLQVPSAPRFPATGPPIPPAESQSLIAVPISQPRLDEVQDVVVIQQEEKGTQTEETAYGTNPDVMSKIAGIEVILKEQSEMLDLILSNVVHQSSRVDVDPPIAVPITDKFVFPICMEQDLIKLNEELMSSCDKASLKRFLIGTGGSTLNDSFQRTMQKILTDDLAVKFSLKGKRGKKAFQDLANLVVALKECVRSYPSLTTLALSGQLDDKSCDEAISRALKKSADRVFQRNKKTEEHAGNMEVN